jgi:hypothetical protein
MLTRDGVAGALGRFARVPADRPDLKAAAVAITLVEDAADPAGTAFLLTPRARRPAASWPRSSGWRWARRPSSASSTTTRPAPAT